MEATIISGASTYTGDSVVGKTVAEVREEMVTSLNIAPNAPASVGGEPVGEDYVIQAGDTLEFTRPAGEKGL